MEADNHPDPFQEAVQAGLRHAMELPWERDFPTPIEEVVATAARQPTAVTPSRVVRVPARAPVRVPRP